MKLTRVSNTQPPATPLKPPCATRSATPSPAPEAPATHAPPDALSAASELPGALAVDEVLDFPAHLLADLPAPWTLTLRTRTQRPTRVIVITASREDYAQARSQGVDVVSKAWVYPLALAAEHGRGTPQALAAWLDRARHGWDLTPEAAIGGLPGRWGRQGWPVGRVLHCYGLQLASVS